MEVSISLFLYLYHLSRHSNNTCDGIFNNDSALMRFASLTDLPHTSKRFHLKPTNCSLLKVTGLIIQNYFSMTPDIGSKS